MTRYQIFNIAAVSFILVFAGGVAMVVCWPESPSVAAAADSSAAASTDAPPASGDSARAVSAARPEHKGAEGALLSADAGGAEWRDILDKITLLDTSSSSPSPSVSVDPVAAGHVAAGAVSSESSLLSSASASSAGDSTGAASASGGSSGQGGASGDSGDAGGTASTPSSGSSGGSGPPARKSIPEELKKLKPLPKVHYSFWLGPTFLKNEENADLLYELARICHAVSISGEWASYDQVEAAVAACAKVNKTNPVIPATIGVNYMPWHREFRQDLDSPIPGQYGFMIFNHPSYNAEIERFEKRLRLVKEWVDQCNKTIGSNVEVGALLFDCERFYSRAHDPLWNEAMGKAQNDIHRKAVELFPDARIEWYNRGMGGRKGTLMRPYLVDNLIMTGMSCALYSVPFYSHTKDVFEGTCRLADSYVIDGQTPWKGLDVTPWVGLNFGFDWDVWDSGVRPERNCLKMPWEYGVSHSYRIGALLNSFTAPYDRAKVIVLYPPPFDRRLPNWGWHFIEYCKGAAAAP